MRIAVLEMSLSQGGRVAGYPRSGYPTRAERSARFIWRTTRRAASLFLFGSVAAVGQGPTGISTPPPPLPKKKSACCGAYSELLDTL